MGYRSLMYWHLATVLAAFAVGTAQLLLSKGTQVHRTTGRVYLVLMMATALITLLMPAHIGPTLWGHFGYLHVLCLMTLWAVPQGWMAARRGNIAKHKRIMISLYVLALVAAGAFTLMPGRYLHALIWG